MKIFFLIAIIFIIGKSVSTNLDFNNTIKKERNYTLNQAYKTSTLERWKNSPGYKKMMESYRNERIKKTKENEIITELNKINKRLDKLDTQPIGGLNINKDLKYLTKREKARQLGELGNMITTFNNMGLFSWLN